MPPVRFPQHSSHAPVFRISPKADTQVGSLDDEFQDLQLSALLTGIGREAEWLDFPLTTFTAFHRAGWEKCRLRTSRPIAFFADDAFKAGKGGEGGSWPTLARPRGGPVCKQPAMQERQTRTADAYPPRAANLCPLA